MRGQSACGTLGVLLRPGGTIQVAIYYIAPPYNKSLGIDRLKLKTALQPKTGTQMAAHTQNDNHGGHKPVAFAMDDTSR